MIHRGMVNVVFKVKSQFSFQSKKKKTVWQMFGAGSAFAVSSYQNFTVAAESAEKQNPQLCPTHTIGRDRTHMASPYILHPGYRVGERGNIKGC